MRIRERLSTGRPCFSFEFFPPKTDAGLEQLRDSIRALRDLAPSYVSVTYGAGGSTRDRTIELVGEIQRHYGFEAMAHLTCVGSTREEIAQVVDRLRSAGVDNILALRGDPPKGESAFTAVEGGFRHASELAAFIKQAHPGICIGGACYPEGHLECVGPDGRRDLDRDLKNLQQKIDAGAEFLITQLFFDNNAYFNFVARARSAGIGVPIIPGIMPITNVDQVRRFTQMCGASIPESLLRELDRLKDNEDAVLSQGVAYAAAQCFDLMNRGAPGIHFYTLNKSAATRTILTALRTIWPPAARPA
ncbi:MAG: methylenetetrahydrofolate reductase [NAD(P)H] [Planctomycetota bacterium]|nr:MAG: methylenetetrahydrofolate reductase [NAD(P)H] [Planctomycetota bacterium]